MIDSLGTQQHRPVAEDEAGIDVEEGLVVFNGNQTGSILGQLCISIIDSGPDLPG